MKNLVLLGLVSVAFTGCAVAPKYEHTSTIDNATYAYNTDGNGRLIKVDTICPIDGKPFQATGWLSGTSNGLQLDMKRLGRFPQPFILPVCPDNKFVIYKKEFTDGEIETIKTYLASEAYQAIKDTETGYFRLARIYQYLGKSELHVADAYLKATWQLDPGDERYQRYALAAIEHFRLALDENELADLKTHTYSIQAAKYSYPRIQVLIGELYRRAAMYDEAVEHLELLKKDSYMREQHPKDLVVVEFILEAAARKDNAPYTLGDVKDWEQGASAEG